MSLKEWQVVQNYKRWARIFGMDEKFCREGIGPIKMNAGMKALDLGCGPGALSFPFAENAHPDSEIIGVDISEDQLDYARKNSGHYQCKLHFENLSMDELPFEENFLDLVVSSMAIHETPPSIRRAIIKEIARVLKKDGVFIYVDWSKPKLGFWGIIWFPLVCFGERNKDNWNNVYPELCKDAGLIPIEDYYLNSIARRQVFRK